MKRTDIATVLKRSWRKPFTTKSDFAREYATEVGVAASMGFITTRMGESVFLNQWLITKEGLEFLHEQR